MPNLNSRGLRLSRAHNDVDAIAAFEHLGTVKDVLTRMDAHIQVDGRKKLRLEKDGIPIDLLSFLIWMNLRNMSTPGRLSRSPTPTTGACLV